MAQQTVGCFDDVQEYEGKTELVPAFPERPKIPRGSPMAEEAVHITVRPNGPLRVEGHIILKDADGKEWDLTGKPAISLCRCGMSEKRPFCDGAHARNNWQCAAAPETNLT
jgi:CDGSH-type Zn-finger protein